MPWWPEIIVNNPKWLRTASGTPSWADFTDSPVSEYKSLFPVSCPHDITVSLAISLFIFGHGRKGKILTVFKTSLLLVKRKSLTSQGIIIVLVFYILFAINVVLTCLSTFNISNCFHLFIMLYFVTIVLFLHEIKCTIRTLNGNWQRSNQNDPCKEKRGW